jgi:integrase
MKKKTITKVATVKEALAKFLSNNPPAPATAKNTRARYKAAADLAELSPEPISAISATHFRRMLRTLAKACDQEARAAVILAEDCGARVGDVTQLKRKHINLRRGVLVPKAK